MRKSRKIVSSYGMNDMAHYIFNVLPKFIVVDDLFRAQLRAQLFKSGGYTF